MARYLSHPLAHRARSLILRPAVFVYRRLPMSKEEKAKLRDTFFSHLGFLFESTALYKQWRQAKRDPMLDARIPPTSARKATLSEHYPASRPGILFISHDQGGGTEAHIQQLVQRLDAEGLDSYYLRRFDYKRQLRLTRHPATSESTLTFDIDADYPVLRDTLKRLKLTHLHHHHHLDLPEDFLSFLPRLAKDLGLAFDVTLHDYFAICPRFTLFDEATRSWCGEPDVQRCTVCIQNYGSPVGNDIDVAAWRKKSGTFLKEARRIFVPSSDVASRLKRYYPDLSFTLRAHFDTATGLLPALNLRSKSDPLRVVTMGAISPHKGSEVLLNCARDARKRRLPIHFTVLGQTDIDWKFAALPNVTITGAYTAETLPHLLGQGQYHFAFFPGVWPETYCYTLSEALRAGLYPVAFDIGAIAERIRATGWGTLLPLTDYRKSAAINDLLLSLTPAAGVLENINKAFTDYIPFLNTYYGLELRGESLCEAA